MTLCSLEFQNAILFSLNGESSQLSNGCSLFTSHQLKAFINFNLDIQIIGLGEKNSDLILTFLFGLADTSVSCTICMFHEQRDGLTQTPGSGFLSPTDRG